MLVVTVLGRFPDRGRDETRRTGIIVIGTGFVFLVFFFALIPLGSYGFLFAPHPNFFFFFVARRFRADGESVAQSDGRRVVRCRGQERDRSVGQDQNQFPGTYFARARARVKQTKTI